MTYVLAISGGFVDVPPVFTASDGTFYPRSIVDTSTPAFLATIGVYELVPAVIPEGKVATSITRKLVNGKVVETAVLADAPPAPEPRYFTYKGDIWRRVTDAEAAELDTDLTALPPRLRRLWDDSSQINHDDEYGQLLIATMTDRWGAARVSEIMAPSGTL